MRLLPALAAIAAVALLTGCTTNCRSACQHVANICFADAGMTFDVQRCTTSCDENLDGCKNMSDQRSCVGNAQTCSALKRCPGCLQ